LLPVSFLYFAWFSLKKEATLSFEMSLGIQQITWRYLGEIVQVGIFILLLPFLKAWN
jgi:hypothetical protein